MVTKAISETQPRKGIEILHIILVLGSPFLLHLQTRKRHLSFSKYEQLYIVQYIHTDIGGKIPLTHRINTISQQGGGGDDHNLGK